MMMAMQLMLMGKDPRIKFAFMTVYSGLPPRGNARLKIWQIQKTQIIPAYLTVILFVPAHSVFQGVCRWNQRALTPKWDAIAVFGLSENGPTRDGFCAS